VVLFKGQAKSSCSKIWDDTNWAGLSAPILVQFALWSWPGMMREFHL